ncbi:WASH complex subunit 2 isoform X2 [Carcharodon carcharias]|uniref:WASH complex subunit 2 isoform X2 n=1 Tax=Carcharodon carcharias TaxID=13397 RepID=UPI001B7E4C77|nr:WASH complex subunit 2 isoform X2 [Carcharodon carcharias]
MMNGPSVTVNNTLAQNACEAEPVWERPWTLEEIHKASGTWSLGADAGLLLFLQDFSQRMLSRTHEIEKQLDGLIQHTKATDSRLHNVFNDFLMLSNIQFIENRVYDEEVEEAAKPESGGKPIEPEKTREQKEAELIPKVQEAVHHGLRVLDSAFEQLDIKAGNSDSEDEETNERVEHLLEPKDLYIDRPLPYIIGSQQFMEEEDVGLGDLSSEESVDSEHGSVIESEEEKEEESGDDFIDESEDDEQKPPKSVQKQHLVSDEDEDDDSDLFHESEKEDDDDGELTSPKKMGQTSFAEELAARIQGESPKIQDEESAVLTSGGSAKKNRVKVKKETQKVKHQDDDENLFTPENANEDDDYSPFCSKSGLFSGGKGLFDDDEGDLFAEAPKEDVDKGREAKPVVSNEPAARKSGKKVPVGAVSIYPGGDLFATNVISKREHDEKAKVPRASPVREPADAGGLFDDVEDDDLFGSSVKTSTAATTDPKLAAGLFDDSEDSGLFVTPKPAKEKPGVQQNAEPHSEVLESSPHLADKSQTSSGLFSDDDESQDLFSSNKDTKRHQSKQSLGQIRSNQIPISFFDDDDEGDLFSSAAKDIAAAKKSQQSHEPKPPTNGLISTALFDSDDMDEWQSLGLQAPVAERAVDSEAAQPSLRKQVTSKATAASRAPKKTSLFDDYNEEDDLFGVTQKESQKKSQKVSLLFEDDDEGDLFASKPVANKSAPQKPAALPQDSLLFSKIVDSDSVEEFDGKRQLEQGVGAEPMPAGTTRLFAGIEQQSNTKMLDSQGVTTQESDGLFGQSITGLQEELQSNLNPVVSLFDEEDEENLEGTLNQCSLVNDEKLPESGVSTRVFQDEELLFSQHQQKDNDPDVDLFADALKPEVKKSGIKPPVNSPPVSQTKAVELPSNDLFDGADNLFTSKAQSAKAASSTASIFEDSVDEDLFMAVPKKPPVVQKPVLKRTGISQVVATKASEHPKKARDEALNKQRPEEKEKLTNTGPIKTKGPSSRIGKLQANLAINPASLLPGASPKVAVVTSGSVSPSSPPGLPLSEATPSASGPAVSDGASVSFDQPMQANTLTSVNKSRARVGQKRRPPTRGARRLAAQQSDEVEDLDQRLEVDGASGIADFSPTGLAQKPSPDKGPMAKWALPPEPSPGNGAGPAPAPAPIAKLPVHSDLFNSDNLFKPSSAQEPSPAAGARGDFQPKEEPSQSIFAPSEDDLFQSSKRTVKKPKPVAFLEEEGGEDLFGIAKLGQTKPAAQKSSKTLDIFEDDLFSTESVTLTKKSNEGSTDVDLFSDHVDIFADLKVAPKEKKSRKKVETKSIFDDDMDDIFASAMPSASSKKQSKPKTKSKQAAAPTTPGSKAVDIFDDPLNAFGP